MTVRNRNLSTAGSAALSTAFWSASLFGPTLFFSLFVAMFVGACAHKQPKYNYAAEPDPRKQEYVIGASDVLRISVWRNPDLSGEAIVRPDGTITLPLVGDLRAAGRTPGQIRAEITQRLGAFIKDESAIVTVAVATINSYRFTVSGNVEHPGTYASTHIVTVTEAVALAGGANRFAEAEASIIIRSDEKGTRRIPVDYPGILSGVRAQQDLPLIAGDTLYVP
jgi:polysaccharide export outer membrane protein